MLGPKRTDWLTVNDCKVRLVLETDGDGNEFVRVDGGEGVHLEGVMLSEFSRYRNRVSFYPQRMETPAS